MPLQRLRSAVVTLHKNSNKMEKQANCGSKNHESISLLNWNTRERSQHASCCCTIDGIHVLANPGCLSLSCPLVFIHRRSSAVSLLSSLSLSGGRGHVARWHRKKKKKNARHKFCRFYPSEKDTLLLVFICCCLSSMMLERGQTSPQLTNLRRQYMDHFLVGCLQFLEGKKKKKTFFILQNLKNVIINK